MLNKFESANNLQPNNSIYMPQNPKESLIYVHEEVCIRDVCCSLFIFIVKGCPSVDKQVNKIMLY